MEEIIREIYKSNGLSILNEEQYETRRSIIDCIDSDGYKYQLSFDNISDKRTKKFNIVSNKNGYTIYNIQNFIKINGSNTKILSDKYISNKDKLLFRCECGKEYETSWTYMLGSKKVMCNDCGYRIAHIPFKNDKELLESECNKNGFHLIDGINSTTREMHIEDKDGYKYVTNMYTMNNSQNFMSNKLSKFNPYTIENLILMCKKNKIPLKLVDESNRKICVRNDYVELYCSECGCIYKSKIENIIHSF